MGSVSSWLRAQRIELGISLRALSKSSGISAAHISRIEREERIATPTVIRKLAYPLHASVDDLLVLAGYTKLSNPYCIELSDILDQYVLLYDGAIISSTQLKEMVAILKKRANQLG
jgi:transcriptional regulator with XRE-family HTH domain